MAADVKKKNRILYIIEAALEYFVSIAVSGAYLAYLTTAIGMSDALTGVLTSFVSLGCGFQILAIFLRGDVKRNVIALHLINETAFTLLYVTPFFPVSGAAKTVIFTVLLLLGFALNNVANPPKTDWYMQSVDTDKRGVFTANKEIVSLISGMLFSLGLGYVIDGFKASGDVNGAFVVCGVVLGVITICHSLTMIFSRRTLGEPELKTAADEGGISGSNETGFIAQRNENADTYTQNRDESVKKTESGRVEFGKVLRDKNLIKVVLAVVMWRVVQYSTVPFYGTYQIKELGFSMVFVSVLAVAYAIIRALFERPIGKIADKKGFASSLNVCYVVEIAALVVAVFTRPENGSVMYTIHYVLYAICTAGISSGELNLVYDYVKPNERVAALAIKATAAGLAGFLTTLALSPLVSLIQTNGLVLFGVNIYAQQITSFIGLVACVLLVVYNVVVVKKIKR